MFDKIAARSGSRRAIQLAPAAIKFEWATLVDLTYDSVSKNGKGYTKYA